MSLRDCCKEECPSYPHCPCVTADTPADRPERIVVEGDEPKVGPTRHHFTAVIAGLKTAEEYTRQIEHENAAMVSELVDLQAEERRWYENFHDEMVRADEAEMREAELRDEVERLTAEAREHVTELNLATINSFHAGEQSKEAELAALRQALAEITEGLARMEWCEWGCDENARAVLAASAREVTP